MKANPVSFVPVSAGTASSAARANDIGVSLREPIKNKTVKTNAESALPKICSIPRGRGQDLVRTQIVMIVSTTA